MQPVKRAMFAALAGLLIWSVGSSAQANGPTSGGTSGRTTVHLAAEKKKAAAREQRARQQQSNAKGPTTRSWSKYKKHEESYADIQKRLAKLGALNGAPWNACNTAKVYCPHPATLILPPAPKLPVRAPQPGTAPPPIPAEVVAYAAVAQMTLVAPAPVIGPPPSINPWKIAAVGYPLWLSVAGNTDPAPVETRALDIAVSLDARLTKVVFDMGDGHRVTCTDVSRAWHRGIEPGTPSPTCGYRYDEPSLPRGRYTVTARSYWAVAWRTPDGSGTIELVQNATTELPVGELQVVIR